MLRPFARGFRQANAVRLPKVLRKRNVRGTFHALPLFYL